MKNEGVRVPNKTVCDGIKFMEICPYKLRQISIFFNGTGFIHYIGISWNGKSSGGRQIVVNKHVFHAY